MPLSKISGNLRGLALSIKLRRGWLFIRLDSGIDRLGDKRVSKCIASLSL